MLYSYIVVHIFCIWMFFQLWELPLTQERLRNSCEDGATNFRTELSMEAVLLSIPSCLKCTRYLYIYCERCLFRLQYFCALLYQFLFQCWMLLLSGLRSRYNYRNVEYPNAFHFMDYVLFRNKHCIHLFFFPCREWQTVPCSCLWLMSHCLH